MRKHSIVVTLSCVVAILCAGSAIAAKIDISVSKVSQKMTVKIDGVTKHVWPVSTGASGYETPSGKFRPFRMEEDHYSEEWDNAPMPHSVFFTGEGHAIHGSQYVKSLGRRASHGCIRLAPQNAAKLFGMISANGMKNTTIAIKGGFFDFEVDDEPLLPKGFRLASKSKSVSVTKNRKKRKSFFASLTD